ncbi:MAG: hypothetical protein C5B43_01860 [Verrucomicrobia bacterium]|nr:MAG: hypothetical protein C5B43_01860 [Verrucomicrobiota bacterium]
MKKRKPYTQIIKFTLFVFCGILGTELSATEFKNIEITNNLKYDIELHLKVAKDDDENTDNEDINENDEQINSDEENSFHFATIKAGKVDQSIKVTLERITSFKNNPKIIITDIDYLPEDYELVFKPNKQTNQRLHFNYHEIKINSELISDFPYYEEIAIIEGYNFIGKMGIVFSEKDPETLKIIIDSQDSGLKPPSSSWNFLNQ